MRTSVASDRWLAYRRPRPGARVRLFCLPHAGGGASLFHGWADRLPPAVEVCPVQLPGRETRFGEPPFTRIGPLICALAEALLPLLDRPFAFFGHSLGALLGFEVARRLRRERGPQPVRLFASACAAPQSWERGRPIHALPDAEFRKKLRRLRGTSSAILDNEELMEILLPTLRADFALCETCAYAEDDRLSCPITALGGLRDRMVRLRQTLSADEEQRAAGFRFPRDRVCYVVCRGAVRVILGNYLRRRPEELRFSYNAEGISSIAGESPARPSL